MNYSVFQFNLVANDEIRLPYYKGAAFRGLFGHSLRRTVCVTHMSSCENCILRYQCVYAYMFETFNERNERVVRPFVLEPPLSGRGVFLPNDALKVNLILFGKAIQYLPYLVLTFIEMGKRGLGKNRGKFWLKEVTQGNRLIYDYKSQIINTDFPKKQISLVPAPANQIQRLKLHFVTPTALKSNGKIVTEIDFVLLLKAIIRRLKALSVYHNGRTIPEIDLDLDIAQRSIKQKKSFSPFHWKRYSSRQHKEIDFSGIVGELLLEGELSPFLPLLRIGEIVHVGRGTVYGMGKYVIEEIN